MIVRDEKGINVNHVAMYSGKFFDMGYISDHKKQFKFACMRVRDNIQSGEVGLVLTPKGDLYEVSRSTRKAKLIRKGWGE